jgi:hypothetical protein
MLAPVQEAAQQTAHADRRPIAHDVHTRDRLVRGIDERLQKGENLRHVQMTGIPIHHRVGSGQYVFIERDVQRPCGQIVLVRRQPCFDVAAFGGSFGMLPQRAMIDLLPPSALEALACGSDDDFARTQQRPRCQPTIRIVEIDGTADMKDALQARQLSGVPQPSTAVQQRYAAHPIGMIVDHQQIEGTAQTTQQSQTEMMEVAGTEESANRFLVVTNAGELRQAFLKACE